MSIGRENYERSIIPILLHRSGFSRGTIALAIAVPYAVDMMLERFARYERFMKALSVFTAVIAVIAMISLAILRGQVFGQQLQQANAVVVIDGDASVPIVPPNTFYQRTEWLLQIFMVFAAFAIELIAGYAFHAGRRLWAEMPGKRCRGAAESP